MKEVKLTPEQFDKLPDAEYRRYITDEWQGGFKFVRRARQSVTLAKKMFNGSIVASNYNVSCVRVNGVQLEFVDKLSFTNPKSPFGKAI